jgi:hypothetical protein
MMNDRPKMIDDSVARHVSRACCFGVVRRRVASESSCFGVVLRHLASERFDSAQTCGDVTRGLGTDGKIRD